MKNIKFLFAFLILSLSLLACADDFFSLKKYTNAHSIPQAFYQLGGGTSMVNKAYVDDDGAHREDKIYYTITHKYKTSLSASEIRRLLNPANSRLGQLFEETTVTKTKKTGEFKVLMNISTPLKTFPCESTLTYSTNSSDIFTYRFADFNMVFTDFVIQIEIEEQENYTKVSLFQIAALKGMTHQKLKKFFAVERFENSLKGNVNKFKNGIGGF